MQQLSKYTVNPRLAYAIAGVTEAEVAVGQWRPGQDFGRFSEETFKQYY